jgi:hypothetical protein
MLALLAAQRAELLQLLLHLPESALVGEPVVADRTVTDLLAHLAAWDRWQHQTMRSMVAGDAADLTLLQDRRAASASFVAAWRRSSAGLDPGQALAAALADLREARSTWTTWLRNLPIEELYRPRRYAGADWSFCSVPMRMQWQHDGEHIQELADWRAAEGLAEATGPMSVLAAALAASRDDLLAAADLVPSEVRDSLPVEGEWTLKDVLGHVADWELYGVEGLRQMAAGRPPQAGDLLDIESWNQSHALARQDQPWAEVSKDLRATRQALIEALATVTPAALDRSYDFPWGPRGTVYQWVCIWPGHDCDHARGIRTEG